MTVGLAEVWKVLQTNAYDAHLQWAQNWAEPDYNLKYV